MKLYHFCAAQMVTSILSEGLTLGRYPLISDNGTVNFIEPCQWLTTEPVADKQSWATSVPIPYSRTAYRLTVQIPNDYHKLLIHASNFEKLFKGVYAPIVEGWEGSDCWYIYLGKIPPEWITDYSRPAGKTKSGKAGGW